jgi:hypothetical protein
MIQFYKCLVLSCLVLGSLNFTHAQVAINTTAATPDNSSMLDVSSTSKGVLVPRMSKTQRQAIASPASGLLVYQNAPDSTGFYFYDGLKWVWLISQNNVQGADTTSWKTTGNNTYGNEFIGTLNDMPLRFRRNNFPSGWIDSTTRNTSFGFRAGSTELAINNTAMGYKALASNTGSGQANVAIGNTALGSNGAGARNVAIGDSAMYANASGNANVAIGAYAARNLLNAGGNVAIGRDAMLNLNSGNNTIIGFEAGESLTSGNTNTLLGLQAGKAITSGNSLLLLGSSTSASNGLTNAGAIGHQASVTADNSLILGSIASVNSATNSTKVGIGTTSPQARLHVRKEGTTGTGLYQTNAAQLIENNTDTTYLQFATPTGSTAGIISGNAATAFRSGIEFGPDSVINFKVGGTNTRMHLTRLGKLGVGQSFATNVNSTMDVKGSFATAITISAVAATSLTLSDSYRTYVINSASASLTTIILPAASTCEGREYKIVNQRSVSVNFSPVSYLNFANTSTTSIAANAAITIQSDGTNWYRTQ